MKKLLPFLKYLIGWPLSLVSLFFIFKLIYSNTSALSQIGNINVLFLFLGISFYFVYFILRSIVWHEIVKEKGNKLSFKKTTYFWEISEIKRYTPGNVWALLSRTDLFTKNNLSTKDMVSSLFNESWLIILSCLTLSYFYISTLLNNKTFDNILLFLILLLILIYVVSGTLKKKIKLNSFFEKFIDTITPGKNYLNNTKIYLISVLSFFMYALATYFSAVSIFYIDLKDVTQILSLFVFSLLIGYLSIITPMGLGVREGAVTLGLSNFMTASQAGIIAIFSRIVFIISEVVFLISVFAWEKFENSFIRKTETFLTKYKHELLLLVLIFVYILYYTTASFLRYDNFYTGRFDLGNMDQAVWNSINGRLFQFSDPNGTAVISRLSFHADFILVLISPLYLLWESPKMLLFLQTMILSLGAVFVFLISNRLLKNKNISLVFAFLYLINPAVGYTNLYDFHPVTLGTTFLLGSFYYLLKEKYFLFIVFSILSGLTKEQVWSTIALLGATISVREVIKNKFKLNLLNKKQIKNILIGLFVFIASISIFYYLIWHAIPNARGGDHFALEYYSEFGTSASDIARNVILSPLKTLSIIFQKEQINYLMQLFAPLGYLSALSPFILIYAASDLGINLLSSNPQLHQIYYQYTSAVTPFLFIAAIYSVRFITKRFKKISINAISLYLILTALISAYLIGPLPVSKKPNIDMFTKQLSSATEIENFLTSIPKEKSVAATNNLGSHLSRRKDIFTIPIGIDKADYVVFLLNDGFAQPSLEEQKEMVVNLTQSQKYKVVFRSGDFIALEKNPANN